MENAILALHLILALALIGVVLMQRSEGGGLGMSSGGGLVTGRSASNALTKVTWGLAAAFICTSIALTILAAASSSSVSVLDRIGVEAPAAPDAPAPATGTDLLPPTTGGAPALPPRTD
jgi:preprotein translocase subunit SecG